MQEKYFTKAAYFFHEGQRWEQFIEENKHILNTKTIQEFTRQKYLSNAKYEIEKFFAKRMPEFVDKFKSEYDGEKIKKGTLVVRTNDMTGEEMDEAVEKLLTEIEAKTDLRLTCVTYRKDRFLWTLTFSGTFQLPVIHHNTPEKIIPIISPERIRKNICSLKSGKQYIEKTILPERRAVW